MPIASSVTAVNAALKLLYKKNVPNLSYNKQALLSKLPVKSDFTGEKKILALQTSNPQGFGSSFASALANAGSVESFSRFEMFRIQHYGFARVAGEVMRTAVDPGALVPIWRNRTASIVRGMQNSAGRLVYGSGTGKIGTVGVAITALTPTITLQTASDIANFEVGMNINIYNVDSFAGQYHHLLTGIVASQGAYDTTPASYKRTVLAVDRDINTGAAVLTVYTASPAAGAEISGTLTPIAVGAIITRDGDGVAADGAGAGYDVTARAPAGLEQWIGGSLIGTQPTGNSLFGLNRSADKVRLGGQVSNATGRNMVEALQDLEANILFQGIGYPTSIVVNPLDFGNLKKSALSDVIRNPSADPKQNLNFSDVVFMGQNGPIPFLQDPFCPRNRAYMLNMDTWALHTAPGGMFQLVDWDGNSFLRLSDADNYEARFASYYQMGCDNPGSNGYLYNWGV